MKKFVVENFRKLSISSIFNARVIKSEEFKIVVDSDDEDLLERIKVRQVGDTVSINYEEKRSGFFKLFSIGSIGSIDIEIYCGDLDELKISGVVKCFIDNFVGDSIKIKQSGATKLEGIINYKKMDLKNSGTSYSNFEGVVEDLTITCSGCPKIEFSSLKSDYVNIIGSGCSMVEVNCSGDVDLTMSGSSKVKNNGSGRYGKINTSGLVKIS